MGEIVWMYPEQAEAIDAARGMIPRSRVITEFITDFLAKVDVAGAIPLPRTKEDYVESDLKRYHVIIPEDVKDRVVAVADSANLSIQRIYYTAITHGLNDIGDFSIKCKKSTA